jgi:hypothetical protein
VRRSVARLVPHPGQKTSSQRREAPAEGDHRLIGAMRSGTGPEGASRVIDVASLAPREKPTDRSPPQHARQQVPVILVPAEVPCR